jgi:hypothetical protein
LYSRRARTGPAHFAVLALLAGAFAARAIAQGDAEGCRPNLSIFQDLSFRVGTMIADSLRRAPGDSMRVEFRPAGNSWFFEEGVLRGLASKGLEPNRSPTARFAAEVTLGSSSVRYADPRRDGFLGPKIVNRGISLLLTVRVVDRESGHFELSRSFEESYQDTVRYGDIDRLEQPLTPVTHGELASAGFFSSVLEPVVLIGALAVAVLLLFTVRS